MVMMRRRRLSGVSAAVWEGAVMGEERSTGWFSAIRTGLEWQDADHRHLIGAMDLLEDSLSTGQQGQVLDDILDRIDEYAQHHFAREEERMQATAYPDEAAHRLAHDDFMEQVEGFVQRRRQDRSQGRLILSDDLAIALRRWFVRHIQTMDQDLAAHLKQAGCLD